MLGGGGGGGGGWGFKGGGAAGGADRGGKRRGRRGRDAAVDDGVLRRLLAVRKGRDLLARALALTVAPQVPSRPPTPSLQQSNVAPHTQKRTCACGDCDLFL